jgi:hypothetical protein
MNLNCSAEEIRALEQTSLRTLIKYSREGKFRVRTNANLSKIIAAFKSYKHNFQTPCPILQLPSDIVVEDRKIFHDLYSSSRFPEIEKRRKVESWEICPYCGLRNSVTLDHYLPRRVQDFPHLSFFLLNLIPACGDCQQKKGTSLPLQSRGKPSWYKRRRGCAGPRRVTMRSLGSNVKVFKIRNYNRVIHPYLDVGFDYSRIELKFDFDPLLGPYNFRLIYQARKGALQTRLFNYHSFKLDLNERLMEPLRKEWNSFGRYLRTLGFGPGIQAETVRVSILALAAKSYEKLGELSMEYKFAKAVACDNNCIEYLINSLSTTVPPLNILKKKGRRIRL